MVGGSRMSLLFVDVDVPSEIGLDGLLQNINNIGATHGNVVFETVFTDVFHQFLQVIHLCYSDATVHSVGIVGQFALAQIGLDASFGIVGGKSEKGEAVSMYALSLASGQAPALLDWNNNFADDRNKCVCTHCGNFPRSFIGNDQLRLGPLGVLGRTLGKINTFGAVCSASLLL